jgi:hypothetical protein
MSSTFDDPVDAATLCPRCANPIRDHWRGVVCPLETETPLIGGLRAQLADAQRDVARLTYLAIELKTTGRCPRWDEVVGMWFLADDDGYISFREAIDAMEEGE